MCGQAYGQWERRRVGERVVLQVDYVVCVCMWGEWVGGVGGVSGVSEAEIFRRFQGVALTGRLAGGRRRCGFGGAVRCGAVQSGKWRFWVKGTQ